MLFRSGEKQPATGQPDPATKSTARQAPAGDNKTVTIIDGSSGKRQDVVIGTEDADKAGGEAAPGMAMAGIDARLLEKSRYGMIPMVADGLKPFTVYAADADRTKAAKMPVVAIAPNDSLLEKLKSNLQEVRARGGELYVVADLDSHLAAGDGIHLIRVSEYAGLLSPIVHVVPLQLLAYHAAVLRGTDVDKTRNLAKSVTVE